MATKTLKSTPSMDSFSMPDLQSLMRLPREILLAGLGTLSLASKKSEELFAQGSRFFDTLVSKGERVENRSRQQVEKQAEEVRERFADLAGGIRLPRIMDRGKAETVVFHLVPQDEQWALRLEGKDVNVSTHRTKQVALDAGRALAHAFEPSRIVVHRADGTIQTSYDYGDND